MKLKSTNPFDTPLVDTNILGADGEAEQMAACLAREREVNAQMPQDFQMTEISSYGDTITTNEVSTSV